MNRPCPHPAPSDLLMGAAFTVIETLRRAGVGSLDAPIESPEADTFSDWCVNAMRRFICLRLKQEKLSNERSLENTRNKVF